MSRYCTALLFTFVLMCAPAGAAQPSQAGVAVRLEAVRPSVGRGDDVLVRVTLTNTSGLAQHVLRWRTPRARLRRRRTWRSSTRARGRSSAATGRCCRTRRAT